MSSGSPPQPPSPGASAQAEIGSEAAGTMMNIANAPIQGYANAYTSAMINPYTSALATALGNQGALSNAQAQESIQSQVDPQAYNERQMQMQSSNQRLGRLYGVNPTSASYSAPGAFAVPSLSMLPDLATVSAGARAIAGNIQSVNVNSKGANPVLQGPSNPGSLPQQTLPNNYLYA